MTGGLEEWIRQGMEDEVKKNGGLRLEFHGLRPLPGRASVPIQRQKEALIALSRAPKEFLWSVTRLLTAFLSDGAHTSSKYQRLPVGIDIVQSTLLELKNVTRIDGPFLQNLRWPDTVIDLSHMTQLKVIGNGFLRGSVVRDVFLPMSLEVIGNDFLESSHISRVDLSHTTVERIGSGFLAFCNGQSRLVDQYRFNEVLFPPTLKVVGREFLAGNHSMGKVDLSLTVLESVGNDFLSDTHVRVLLVPSTLKHLGRNFLSCGGTKILDLSHTAIQDIGSYPLFRGSVKQLILPRTVEKIGEGFLDQCGGELKKVDLSRTKLAVLSHSFLRWSNVGEVILPGVLQSCCYLNECSFKKIDLSRVGPGFQFWPFLRPDSEVELVLPNAGPLCRDWRKLFKEGKGDKATVRFVSPPKDAEADTDNA